MVPNSFRVGSMTIYSMVRPSDSLTPNTGRASGSTLRTFSIVRRSYSVTRPSALSVSSDGISHCDRCCSIGCDAGNFCSCRAANVS